jgi:ketosteroid isomerase-like protein
VAGDVENELRAVIAAWDSAMIQNDVRAIGRFMADGWTIIGPDGSCSDKAGFLGLIDSGALTHDVMQSNDVTVRVYGDTAVVLAQGVSGGKFRGQPFREVERQSNVFIRQETEWKCVLTHLSRLPT